MQNFAHGAQLQSVVMLQLEYHALPGRQLLQSTVDTLTQLAAHQVPLRARSRPAVRHLLQQVVLAAGRILSHGCILFSYLLLTRMFEEKVSDNPVDPGVEETFKAKAANVLVRLEEGILVDVLRVVFRTGK